MTRKKIPNRLRKWIGFISKILDANEEVKNTSKDVWRLRRFE
jgi:hypothetical protein